MVYVYHKIENDFLSAVARFQRKAGLLGLSEGKGIEEQTSNHFLGNYMALKCSPGVNYSSATDDGTMMDE